MIMHVDMDAFFASVEQLDNPQLRGRPVIVGGKNRGVVATASYEARRFGLHSAMPIATARRLCPHGVYVTGRYGRYREVSAQIMACLRGFSPLVQPASIDEAYIDVTGMGRQYKNPYVLGYAIKRKIFEETGGLTCSIGAAPVKFLAKICSDARKPDGLFVLLPDGIDNFLLSLPVCALPGVGKRMQESLREIGIVTIEQLRKLSPEYLSARYGKFGQILYERARGIDGRAVHDNAPAKSESVERTFAADTLDRRELAEALSSHAERVSAALQKGGVAGRTVTLKIKFADFKQITRSRTLDRQIREAQDIYEVAMQLFEAERLPQPVRLIGICVSGFAARAEQLYLPGLENRVMQPRRMYC